MTSDSVGGVGTYALELAGALPDVEFVVASMGPATTDHHAAHHAAKFRALPNVQLHEASVRLEWMQNPWEDVQRAGEWLLALEAQLAPDLVHVNSFAHGALPWRAPRLVVGHSCVLSWWAAVRGGTAPPEWDRYRAEVTRGLQAADIVIAPTQFMFDQLGNFYGPFRDARVIYNARNPAYCAPGTKREYAMSAGRFWDEAKNLRVLDDAAEGLAWPICVAGPLRLEGAFSNAQLATPQYTRPLGVLSPELLADCLSHASIFALPVIYEPFGLAPLEAALAGCALVLGDTASMREVWGDAAIFTEPRDVRALHRALASLMRDVALRERMAAAARARALIYSPARMGAAYLSVYRELAGRTKRAAQEAVACAS